MSPWALMTRRRRTEREYFPHVAIARAPDIAIQTASCSIHSISHITLVLSSPLSPNLLDMSLSLSHVPSPCIFPLHPVVQCPPPSYAMSNLSNLERTECTYHTVQCCVMA